MLLREATSVEFFGYLLFLIGMTGILVRRHMLAVAASFIIASLGVFILFAHANASILFIISYLMAIVLSILSSCAIFTYRNRNTLHVDELRELRG